MTRLHLRVLVGALLTAGLVAGADLVLAQDETAPGAAPKREDGSAAR
ncbi:MAG: hypothetical protein Q8O61_08575 [Nocardioides sp.]|nr:hypothetical protein [Nocardioides sp.]